MKSEEQKMKKKGKHLLPRAHCYDLDISMFVRFLLVISSNRFVVGRREGNNINVYTTRTSRLIGTRFEF